MTAKASDVDEFSNKISLSIRAPEKLDVPDFHSVLRRIANVTLHRLVSSSLAKKPPIWIGRSSRKFVKIDTRVNRFAF